jgi:hypothetical protein
MESNNFLKKDPVTKIVINKDEKSYNDYKFKIDVTQQLKILRKEIEVIKNQLVLLKEKN